MKNFLTTSFVALALIIGATGAAPVAHAESLGGVPQEGQACDITPGKADGIMQGGVCVASAAYISKSQTAAANTQVDYSKSSSEDAAYNGIMIKIMTLFAWLVGVAMVTLNYAVFYTVVSMGNFVSHLTAIGVTWRILRDIGNIVLIFGFLAIGISIILNTERIGYGKKMLPMLLVAAVFLNFSLFITEAVIDTGNLFATQFYTQISGGTLPTAETLGKEGISDKIMSQLGLQTIYGDINKPDKAKEIFKGGNPWIIGFMGILLFIVLAFVLFSLAFILIARFVMLIFLIILAPIGFAGLAVPQLAHKAGQWWDALFAQTITAPILLLLLYIALAVITDAQFLTGFGSNQNADWLGTVTGNIAGFAPVFLSFLIAMGLLLAVTMAAKGLSAFGAGKATALAGKLTFGATAWGMRSTVGWGANKAAKYARSTRLARVPLVGTGIVRGLDKVATGSLDIRGAKTFGGLKGMGVEAGEAQKGGYRAELKERTESRTKYAKELTGRELTEEETINQKMTSDAIKATEKRLTEAQVRQREMVAAGKDTQDINDEIVAEKRLLVGHKTKLDEIESVTAKGAQRKYASVLELGFGEKSKFNKYFNFAANTEAAKAIRKEAKKSGDDQTLDALKKALKKAGGEEEKKPEAPKPEAAH